LVRAVETEEDVKNLPPERVAAAYERFLARWAAMEDLGEFFEDYAREQPLHLSNGQVYGKRKQVSESVVPEQALEAMSDIWGPDIGGRMYRDSLKTTTSITREALKGVIKKHVFPTLPENERVLKYVERKALDELRLRRSVTVLVKEPVTLYKPTKEEKAQLDADAVKLALMEHEEAA
jgi:hypothetical protein